MRVMVLGAGVIGISSAYYLAKAGHEVVVIERQAGPARATSFANAGGICPGFAGPWAAPGMPRRILRWLVSHHAALSIRPRFNFQQWRWLARFLRNCSAERFAHNKTQMQRIAHYSKGCLTELRAETGIAFDHGTGGVLQVFRTEKELAAAENATRVLVEFGVRHRIVDAGQVLEIEPALCAAKVQFTGGLHLPDDETGDCHQFTVGLTELLRKRGAELRFNTGIEHLLADDDRVTGVITSVGTLKADSYVVALGSQTSRMLRPLGIDLAIYPVKGYSITIDLEGIAPGPRSCVMDEHSKILITRLGSRIRVAGVAEIGGYDLAIRRRGAATLRQSLDDLFPQLDVNENVHTWAGLRPMTPDGPPYLGHSRFANLFINAGHGSNGWTQACGSGRIISDVVSGRPPSLDLTGFGLDR